MMPEDKKLKHEWNQVLLFYPMPYLVTLTTYKAILLIKIPIYSTHFHFNYSYCPRQFTESSATSP